MNGRGGKKLLFLIEITEEQGWASVEIYYIGWHESETSPN